jgi:hypothetical protein
VRPRGKIIANASTALGTVPDVAPSAVRFGMSLFRGMITSRDGENIANIPTSLRIVATKWMDEQDVFRQRTLASLSFG